MLNCFIDPIFLAISDNITSKHYSEVIFPVLYDLCNKIEELENNLNKRIINFNITYDLILLSMEFNPYRFRSSIYCSSWFKKFLSNFLKIHRNSNCDIISNDNDIDLIFKFENDKVPSSIIEDWNIFLNKCSKCSYIDERNLEFLTLEGIGSKNMTGTPNFFNSYIIDLLNWLNKQDFTIIPSLKLKPAVANIKPNLKKKGNWKHSKTKQVIIEVIKIQNCEYVSSIQPIGKTRKINRNLLELENNNQIRVYIKDASGTHIFIITTTARNATENQFIFEEISKILPDFKKK